MVTPEHHAKINAIAFVIWLLLGIPSWFFWKNSVTWVVFMSWYAIVVSHVAAYIAARAEQKADE